MTGRRVLAATAVLAITLLADVGSLAADEGGYDEVQAGAETTPSAVRVTVVRTGGVYTVRGVEGGSTVGRQGCVWTLVFAPALDDAPYGISP
ncbi:MAG: hypothetical protein ACRDYW_05550, partial [Acidimicrobiales bacterium]